MAENERKRFLRLGAGAVLSAVGFSLTGLCCLPAAAGMLGVGLAGIGTRLIAWRPLLTSLSLICLGVAFYQAYRPQRCDQESCEASTGRRGRRLAVWCMAVCIGTLLTLQYWGSWLIYWFS